MMESRHRAGTKAMLLLASSLTVMSGAAIAPALPLISRTFSETPRAELLTKLLLTTPALFIALAAPFAGSIIDRFGRLRLLAAGLLLFSLAGSSGLWLWSLGSLLLGRALLGIAVAAVMTTSTTLIGDYYHGAERNSFMGTQSAFMALGGMVFLTLSGYLAEYSWRWPFLVYLAALLLLPGVSRWLWEPEDYAHTDRPDPAGGEPPEAEGAGRAQLAMIYLVGYLVMAFFYLIPVEAPFLLKNTLGVENHRVGLAISAMTATSALAAMNYQRLRRFIGIHPLYALAYLLSGSGYLLIAGAENYSSAILALMVAGAGLGIQIPNTNIWLLSSAPQRMRGRLVGGLTTAFFLGQFSAPLLAFIGNRLPGGHGPFAMIGVLMFGLAALFSLKRLLSGGKPETALD